MNYLGHFFLSRNERKELIVGNFLGDFVKGKKQLATYSPEVVKGILLHRAIDDFTDRHPMVLQSKKRLFPFYRHYAAVLVDLFYDHFLAASFSSYSSVPLGPFSQSVYSLLNHYFETLPPKAQHLLPFMEQHNWLLHYQQLEGISRACEGLSRRTTFKSKMELGARDLQAHYGSFRREFTLFFEDIQQFTEDWIKTN